MIVTLFFVGIATGKIAWVLIAIGGIVVTVATLIVQYIFYKALGWSAPEGAPGSSIIEACSILPIAVGGTYSAAPSLWVAISSFFVTYIFTNASNVYTTGTKRASKDALAVQQRKGVGLISMMAVVVLFAFLLVPRYWTTCETTMGIILGLAIGMFSGYTWWKILDSCGADVYPDIHGVMIGLKPGTLHSNPIACAPPSKK
jgi:hypothetical protein